jgi:predicted nucleotidyltransferase
LGVKVEKGGVERTVYYDDSRWNLLKEKREVAKKVILTLESNGIHARTHGSIARGDVNVDSDVDVFFTEYVPSYKVELVLEKTYTIYKREVVQATPRSTPKAYLYLDPYEKTCVSFPLARLLKNEIEFYEFGGTVGLKELYDGVRKKGVNKKLMLIIPKDFGHVERSILGKEAEVAKELGISLETVMERVRVLSKRDEVGRTGTFLKLNVPREENVEKFVRDKASSNWMLRKVIEERGYF